MPHAALDQRGAALDVAQDPAFDHPGLACAGWLAIGCGGVIEPVVSRGGVDVGPALESLRSPW